MRKITVVGQVLAELEEEDRLRPECLVEDSKDPKHPLHKQFRWGDDKRLAYEARLDIARRIFSSFRVTHTVETRRVSAVKYVKDPRTEGQGYVNLAKVANDEDLAWEVLEHEAAAIKGAVQRAREVAAALELDGHLVRIIEEINGMMRGRSRRGYETHEEEVTVQ